MNDTQKPANAPANTDATHDVDVLATSLLTDFVRRIVANTAPEVVSNPQETEKAVANVLAGIRWEPRPDREPPAIVIMRRGAKVKGVSNLLATISPTGEYADLYPSWEPVLAEWRKRKVANGGKRTKHDGLGVGEVANTPESETK